MATSDKFELLRFDGKDFFLWKFQMRLFLKGQELWDHVDGSAKMPVAADADAPTEAESQSPSRLEKEGTSSNDVPDTGTGKESVVKSDQL